MINHPRNGSELYKRSTPQSLNNWLRGKGNCDKLCERIAEIGDSVNALPWLTLVIGAELTAPTLRPVSVSAIGRAIAYELVQAGINQADATATGVFVASLLVSRRKLDFAEGVPEDSSIDQLAELYQPITTDEAQAFWNKVPRYDPWVLRLFHAAAMVNASYFLAKRVYQIPVNRWDDDPVKQVQFGHSSESFKQNWMTAYSALSKAITAIPKVGEEKPRLSSQEQKVENRHMAVKDLLQTIYLEMDPLKPDSRITSDNLLTLAEVAWYYLTINLIEPKPHDETGVDVSPSGKLLSDLPEKAADDAHLSWPEILLTVGLQRGDAPPVEGQLRPTGSRPRLSDPKTAAQAITSELLAPSLVSAEWWYKCADLSRQENGPSVRRAYRVYADILAAQAGISFHGLPEPDSSEASETQDELDDVLPDQLNDVPKPTNMFGKTEQSGDMSVEHLPTPPATSFVTTFDMEFEMALHRLHPELPFVIVLPVNVDVSTDKDDNLAANVWLGYVVEPFQCDKSSTEQDSETLARTIENWWDDLTADLIDPSSKDISKDRKRVFDPERWFVVSVADKDKSSNAVNNPYDVSSQRLRDLVKEGPLPFVIRLAGAPLINLPDINIPAAAKLRSEIASALGENDSSLIKGLSHALLLEESHSLFLTFPEFDTNTHQGLPPKIANYFPAKYWRYWIMLGVQAADDPVRYRLVAQVAGVPGQPVPNNIRPDRSGMTLNREGALTRQAADLLQWSYFDIVKGDIIGMTVELEHYWRHLTVSGSPIPLVDKKGKCNLKNSGV